MEYKIDDQQLNASTFIRFANQVWPGKYDEEKTAVALSKTMNITAYDGETLVGCLRILQTVISLARLRKCLSFRIIKDRE